MSLRGAGPLACHCEADAVSRSNLVGSGQAPQSLSAKTEIAALPMVARNDTLLSVIRLELLAQRQPLELVRRADPFTIHLFGSLLHPLEEHLEEGLAVVDQERHVVRPHL